MTILTQYPAAAPVAAAAARWTPVCPLADLQPERGVCALAGGAQVAVFRGHDGALYAVSNYDPFSGAFVLSRGIMGSRGDAVTVASPIGKQVFDLATGVCLDEPGVSVPVAAARLTGGVVQVTAPLPGGPGCGQPEEAPGVPGGGRGGGVPGGGRPGGP